MSASAQALAAVRAAKNRIRWGEFAALRYIEKHSVPYRMYILAVVNELAREARMQMRTV